MSVLSDEVFLVDNEARQAGMTKDVFADTADHGTLDGTHPSWSHHDQVRVLVVCDTTQFLTDALRALPYELELDLHRQYTFLCG